MSHKFTMRDHPDNSRNPEGKDCEKCGAEAFIVTQRLKTVEDGLNEVVDGSPLCRDCFGEIYPK